MWLDWQLWPVFEPRGWQSHQRSACLAIRGCRATHCTSVAQWSSRCNEALLVCGNCNAGGVVPCNGAWKGFRKLHYYSTRECTIPASNAGCTKTMPCPEGHGWSLSTLGLYVELTVHSVAGMKPCSGSNRNSSYCGSSSAGSRSSRGCHVSRRRSAVCIGLALQDDQDMQSPQQPAPVHS